MSIDAFIFSRTEPVFGMNDSDVVTIERVQILKPRRVVPDDWKRIRRTPDPSMLWLTDANCTNSSYVQLELFANGLARRCGGGVWWCDMTDELVEVAARPDPGTWSLWRALEVAQQLESDLDHAEMGDDEPGGDPARGGYSFTVGPAGAFTVHGQVAAPPPAQEWEIGVAKRGTADAWTGARRPVRFFALFEGHGANQVGKYALGTMRRALEHTRGHNADAPVAENYAASTPRTWLEWAHSHARETTFKKPFLKRRPQGWGTMSIVRAEGNQLRIAHVGDSRAYVIGPRGIQQIVTEQINPHALGIGQMEPTSAIASEFFKPEEQSVPLEPGDAIILVSFQVWRALRDNLEPVFIEGLTHGDAQSAADSILSHATATIGAVVVAFYGGE